MKPSYITAVRPSRAVEGGRISILGHGFPLDRPELPKVHVGDRRARITYASPDQIDIIVPAGLTDSGPVPVRIDSAGAEGVAIDIGAPYATSLHQVDNPVFDHEGNLYVTYSGTRGEQVPVSIFRVRPDGARETWSSAIVNPTSMAVDPQGRLYVSSRFEGVVYVLDRDGAAKVFAADLGVTSGLAFTPDGTLFVGDRSGTIFKVSREGRATEFASLPPSVAAFHLAFAPDGALHVTGPTLSSRDPIYRVDPDGRVTTCNLSFGRPQGVAFDSTGTLYVVEALAGASGLYRVPPEGDPEMVVSGPALVGLAFAPDGRLIVCSSETAYRFH